METLENTPVTEPKLETNSTIHVRCPDCYKLFAVNSSEIVDSKPRFKCTDCQTLFWIPYPESLNQQEILGFRLEWLEAPETPPTGEFLCPKCQTPYSAGQAECHSCGIVFDKLKINDDPSPEIQSSPEIKDLWERVIQDYDKGEVHQKFVHRCQKEGCLDVAAAHYGQILSAHPGDERARKMSEQVRLLVEAHYTFPLKEREEASRVESSAHSHRERDRRRLPLFALVLVLSALLMGAGFAIPELRNLVGFGASMLFLALALRYYIRKIL